MEFQVRIEAQHLGLNFIPEANQERHDIILSLYWHRYSPTEIAAYLNRLGIKTPRGKTYYGKLVEVTRRKLLLREKRRQKVIVTVLVPHSV